MTAGESIAVRTFRLGREGREIGTLGIGAWAWGSRFVWGYGSGYTDSDLRAAFEASVKRGVRFFDTAEAYGMGHSERLLGEFAQAARADVMIGTKFFPFPWRFGQGSIIHALRKSLERLAMQSVTLYQIHWPSPLISVGTMMQGLAEAVQAGLAEAVGVSNFNTEQMAEAYEVLTKHGISLASNQVEYSLIQRDPERSGLLDLCRDLGVTLIAYSPLGMGMLTGKYTPNHPPSGVRGRRYSQHFLLKLQPLIDLMRRIGEAHGGRTPAQVALNWVIAKGAFPIPGAKNPRQVDDNAGVLEWSLTEEQVAALDAASDGLADIS